MACQCFLVTIGYAASVVIAYKFLNVVFNIISPYLISRPIDLKKKAGANWAVITGATDGIGKAYAFELASRGFNVFLVSRTQSKLDATRTEISEKYQNVDVKTYAYDFSNADVNNYKTLIAELNKVEVGILVNNVGMSLEYPEVLHKVEGGVERLANIAVINTLPPTLLSAGVLEQMVSRHAGVIINVSSSAGANHMSMWAVYSASKKYVTWLSEILRREYSSQGITIQTINPMMVATKMSKVKKTSFFTPSGEVFAKSAVNTIGNAADTTGYITHQLQFEFLQLIPTYLRDILTTRMSAGIRAAALRKKAREAKSE